MQPLDIGIFGPLKLFCDDQLVMLASQSKTTLDRVVLIQTIMRDDVFSKAFSLTNCARGWRESGLHPFDVNAIPVHKFSSEQKVTVRAPEPQVT